MKLKINNNIRAFDNEVSIAEILDELKISRNHGIAVALNYTVVTKDLFSHTYPKDGDSLDIIHATAGG